MLNFQIVNYRTGKSKSVKAQGMNSVYSQYKRFCVKAGAESFIECDASFSIGGGYWMTSDGQEYILRKI